MPQIKSAIKRVKTSEKSHLRNISYKSKVKSIIKKFNIALSEKNKEETNKYFKDSVSILDKSVNKGILPKNNVSRQKAMLNKKLNTLIKPGEAKELAASAPKKAEKVQEKPVVKKVVKAAKKPVAKKAATPKKKIETTKKTETKEKPMAKETVKAVEKPEIKKSETKKVKIKKEKS